MFTKLTLTEKILLTVIVAAIGLMWTLSTMPLNCDPQPACPLTWDTLDGASTECIDEWTAVCEAGEVQDDQ